MMAFLLLLLAPLDYATAYTDILQDILTEGGLVRYALLAKHPEFPAVVEAIETFDFSTADTDAERIAFWMNAYNIHMLNRVTQRPRRDNVLGADGGAVFFETPVRVAGQMLTLNQIENAILRRGEPVMYGIAPSYLDPRIHVGLNCAAISCPRLWPEAFQASRLDEQLDRAMQHFVNSPDHFDIEDGQLAASSLLDWYGGDFDTAERPAGDYLLSFMSEDRPNYPAIREHLRGRKASEFEARFRYNWAVNRAN